MHDEVERIEAEWISLGVIERFVFIRMPMTAMDVGLPAAIFPRWRLVLSSRAKPR